MVKESSMEMRSVQKLIVQQNTRVTRLLRNTRASGGTAKDVFRILYGHAANLAEMDEQSEAKLREVAQLCPLDYGFGVYTARAALMTIDTLPKNYVAECERVPSPEDISQKRGEDETSDSSFIAYPNPINSHLTVDYLLREGEHGDVTIFDLSGRVMKTTVLNKGTTGKNSMKLQLNNLSEGLYVLRIAIDGETKLSERISVIKP